VTVDASIARRAPRFRSRRARTTRQRLGYGVLGIVLVLIPWQLLVNSGTVDPVFLSSPTTVFHTLGTMFHGHEIYQDLWITFKEWGIGFVIAVVVGVFVGIVGGWFRWVGRIVEPWLNVLQAVPELALIPMFILWFGIGLEFKVWVALIAAVFVVAINTIAGVHSTETKYLAVAETYGASKFRLLRTVVLPGSVPYIMTGIRQASGRALVGVVAAEFLAANQGLGFFISLSGQTLNTPQVMAGIVILAIFGIIIGIVFRFIEGRFDKWRRSDA
jgi:ABC-type nitrate/sulfonate/bicarbonate transport system permease component